MKHHSLILLLFVMLLFSPPPLQAQTTVTVIESLTVDLWPDYDQEAVLVLLTGTLSAPGTVTIPLPDNADFHVLARIDSQGNMYDDLGTPVMGNGTITFTTPDVGFRVEYYVPYSGSGNERSFAYTWQGNVAVNQLFVSVQQPTAAVSLVTVPAANAPVRSQNDGLLYHNLPTQTAPPGQTVVIQVNYAMSSSTLTIASQPAITTGSSGVSTTTAAANNNLSTWAIVLGGVGLLLIAIAVTWQLATQQRSTGKRPLAKRPPKTTRSKPAPTRQAAPTQGKAKFCHECGEPAQPGDRFCRSCGAELKRL
ncbi:MAG: zinc ribbon domain-containing protein [Anaerolinea sp.]|nr:zinc ribbon domain-containing protein [Anaerolinea sp.]